MALIYKGMPCPLCHRAVGMNENLFVSNEGIFPRDHPLFAFCDTAMHWDCYERWFYRAEFTRANFQVKIASMKNNKYWAVVLLSDDALVSVGFAANEVAIFLAETGSDIRVFLPLWTLWMRSKWIVLHNRPSPEKQALSDVWPVLQTAFPNMRVLVDKANQMRRKRT